MTRFRWQVYVYLPKFVNVSQPAAELLRFVEKIQNGGIRHLGLLFGNSGPPTKLACGREVAHHILQLIILVLLKKS